MKIITVINDPAVLGFNLLRVSCAVNDHELVALVHNQKSFFSNRIKDNLLREYLQKNDPEELILFTDGFDAFFLAKEEEILEKYYAMKKPVIFSTETACWPDASLSDQYPPADTVYRFLNSGGFIGKAGAILELLEEELPATDNFKRSNQYLWARKFIKHPGNIGLDTHCSLFCTFSAGLMPDSGAPVNMADQQGNYTRVKKWFGSNFTIGEGRIYNKITGSKPCHVHFNGHSKILIDKDMIDLVFGRIEGDQASFVYEKEKNIAKLLS